MRLIRRTGPRSWRRAPRARCAVRVARTIVLVGAVGGIAGACSSSTAPQGPGDPPLSGTWTALCGVDVSCVLHLRESQQTLTGTFGTRVAPTGREYDQAAAGTFLPPDVRLQWNADGVVNHFDGTLEGDTLITGQVTGIGGGYPAQFRKRQ